MQGQLAAQQIYFPPKAAYGWWKVSQITYIASIVSFSLGGLALAGASVLVFTGRKPAPPVIEHEAIAPVETA